MLESIDAVTPEECIDGLEEPRRSDVRAIHDLFRSAADVGALTDLIRAGAAFTPSGA